MLFGGHHRQTTFREAGREVLLAGTVLQAVAKE